MRQALLNQAMLSDPLSEFERLILKQKKIITQNKTQLSRKIKTRCQKFEKNYIN